MVKFVLPDHLVKSLWVVYIYAEKLQADGTITPGRKNYQNIRAPDKDTAKERAKVIARNSNFPTSEGWKIKHAEADPFEPPPTIKNFHLERMMARDFITWMNQRKIQKKLRAMPCWKECQNVEYRLIIAYALWTHDPERYLKRYGGQEGVEAYKDDIISIARDNELAFTMVSR